VTGFAELVAATEARLVVFDASGRAPVKGAVTVAGPTASNLAAAFALLPAAQRFMVDFAVARVPDAGVPVRSSKVTRVE